MNLKEVKELVNIMNENNLSLIEIAEEGKKIKLAKNFFSDNEVRSSAPQAIQEAKSSTKEEAMEVVKETSAAPDNAYYVTSPMVGVFYSSASPEAAPFVKVGSKVKKGDVICIIEAMKLLNEILAERDGEITDIYVSNETVVEFGQKLFQMR
ncbi:acetyl-CoA carboxylase biotin carboxyl carrier protein [Alloiococcus sp. CFN-8]|uniref:acetyl-CoA carboxylase biotin carboxyl carrier protein n=1 Tax=Alloiococcus sp. CFN-8 TaxID=3416081 RepID=UPI003CF41212